MLFNPYTGKPRDFADIASDPSGKLVMDPNMPLLAASAHPSELAAEYSRGRADGWDAAKAARAPAQEPLCWVPEDELPESMTPEAYSALYQHSRVNFIREFPVYAAPVDAQDAVDAKRYRVLRDAKMTFLPRITDPRDDRIGYSPEGLDKICDKAIALQASQTPENQDAVKE